MYNPVIHHELARLRHADLLREAEAQRRVATAAAARKNADRESHGLLGLLAFRPRPATRPALGASA